MDSCAVATASAAPTQQLYACAHSAEYRRKRSAAPSRSSGVTRSNHGNDGGRGGAVGGDGSLHCVVCTYVRDLVFELAAELRRVTTGEAAVYRRPSQQLTQAQAQALAGGLSGGGMGDGHRASSGPPMLPAPAPVSSASVSSASGSASDVEGRRLLLLVADCLVLRKHPRGLRALWAHVDAAFPAARRSCSGPTTAAASSSSAVMAAATDACFVVLERRFLQRYVRRRRAQLQAAVRGGFALQLQLQTPGGESGPGFGGSGEEETGAGRTNTNDEQQAAHSQQALSLRPYIMEVLLNLLRTREELFTTLGNCVCDYDYSDGADCGDATRAAAAAAASAAASAAAAAPAATSALGSSGNPFAAAAAPPPPPPPDQQRQQEQQQPPQPQQQYLQQILRELASSAVDAFIACTNRHISVRTKTLAGPAYVQLSFELEFLRLALGEGGVLKEEAAASLETCLGVLRRALRPPPAAAVQARRASLLGRVQLTEAADAQRREQLTAEELAAARAQAEKDAAEEAQAQVQALLRGVKLPAAGVAGVVDTSLGAVAREEAQRVMDGYSCTKAAALQQVARQTAMYLAGLRL